MATYKTPGVYVEEISTMPPSVAEVETAIPAFIGFTETGAKNIPKRITSLLEYQLYFGGAAFEQNINVSVSDSNEIEITMPETSKNVMFYAMQLYFANGGGPCYIVSTGAFEENTASTEATYKSALDAIAKEDEPTLLVFPDAPFSLDSAQYYTLMNDAIQQCTKLGDRFAIVDVLVVDPVDTRKSIDAFRQAIAGSESVNLKYGAAYFPYLNTTINYNYDETLIQVGVGQVKTELQNTSKDLRKRADDFIAAANQAELAATASPDDTGLRRTATTARTRANTADAAAKAAKTEADREATLDQKTLNSLLMNKVKLKLNQKGVVLTPCAAIAGVYASVDNARGVWKAPANVSLNYVTSTTVKVTDDDQDNMNIDVVDGKSVNAIRPFIGKGVKVWGARTLDGNDNEWRYISVRRFFNMVEESVKKSTYWAVFEPNDKNTWTKVSSMIQNYLVLKWRDGALAGAKPDDAFFVHVGLGQTMTPQDVLEGYMIVEIGLAAVRPAEFIILKFSHKLQTS